MLIKSSVHYHGLTKTLDLRPGGLNSGDLLALNDLRFKLDSMRKDAHFRLILV